MVENTYYDSGEVLNQNLRKKSNTTDVADNTYFESAEVINQIRDKKLKENGLKAGPRNSKEPNTGGLIESTYYDSAELDNEMQVDKAQEENTYYNTSNIEFNAKSPSRPPKGMKT